MIVAARTGRRARTARDDTAAARRRNLRGDFVGDEARRWTLAVWGFIRREGLTRPRASAARDRERAKRGYAFFVAWGARWCVKSWPICCESAPRKRWGNDDPERLGRVGPALRPMPRVGDRGSAIPADLRRLWRRPTPRLMRLTGRCIGAPGDSRHAGRIRKRLEGRAQGPRRKRRPFFCSS